jgi:hypothetical protein
LFGSSSAVSEDPEVDLIVEVTDISQPGFVAACAKVAAKSLLVCGRCEDIEEIVVAILTVPALDASCALCGCCARSVPSGFLVT